MYKPRHGSLCDLQGIPAAEFLGVIGTKVLGVFFLAIHSRFFYRILPPTPFCKSCLLVVCNVNIVHGNLKSENSQDLMHRSLNEILLS
jgi:hypothetical protein